MGYTVRYILEVGVSDVLARKFREGSFISAAMVFLEVNFSGA